MNFKHILLQWMTVTIALGAQQGFFGLPPGLNIQELQNLMRVIDPKTCGCAPREICEIPIPQASSVGVYCETGEFCCRRKRHASLPSQAEINNLAKQAGHLLANSGSRNIIPKEIIPADNSPFQDPNLKFTIARPYERKENKVVDSQKPVYINPQNEARLNIKLSPEDLGITDGSNVIIKPAYEMKKQDDTKNKVTKANIIPAEKVCSCINLLDCRNEDLDLSFGVSCPHGQGRCCTHLQEDTKDVYEKPDIEEKKTASQFTVSRGPSNSRLPSQVRPVNLPLQVVPTIPTTTTTTTKTTTTTATTTTTIRPLDKKAPLTKNDIYRGVNNDIPETVTKFGNAIDRSDTFESDEEIHDDNIAIDSESIASQVIKPGGQIVSGQPSGQLYRPQQVPIVNGQTVVYPPRENIYRPANLPGTGQLNGQVAGVSPGQYNGQVAGVSPGHYNGQVAGVSPGQYNGQVYQEPVYYPRTTENPGIIYKVGETAINFAKGLFSWPLSASG